MDEQSPVFDLLLQSGKNSTVNALNSAHVLLNESITDSKTAVTPEFPCYFVVICTTFFILIFLFGILGNVCVMSVVCFNRNMKTAVNLYLLNLCVADILVLTICMPTALADIYAKDAWYFGEAMCKLVPFLENTVANASVLTILAISYERYRVVCQPLKGIQENSRKIIKMVIIIWIISALASLPFVSMATYRPSRQMDGTPIKVCRNTISMSWHKIYIVFLSTFFFGLPCSLLFALYCKICWVLKNTHRENKMMDDARKYRDRRVLQFQVINIITSIVFLFFICHLPLRVIGLWLTFENKYKIASLGFLAYYQILYFGRIMFYLNHACNPIIYNFVSTKFRHAMRYMLTGRGSLGSFVSSQKRKKEIFNHRGHHRQSRTPLVEAEPIVHHKFGDFDHSSSMSSDSRKNRNEFFPMYAKIIQGEVNKGGPNERRCELKIHLVDEALALNINFTRQKPVNNSFNSNTGKLSDD